MQQETPKKGREATKPARKSTSLAVDKTLLPRIKKLQKARFNQSFNDLANEALSAYLVQQGF